MHREEAAPLFTCTYCTQGMQACAHIPLGQVCWVEMTLTNIGDLRLGTHLANM